MSGLDYVAVMEDMEENQPDYSVEAINRKTFERGALSFTINNGICRLL